DFEVCMRVLLASVFFCHREHAARSTRGVIERLDRSAWFTVRVVFRKEKADHQPDHFTWCEMLACCFIGLLGEFSDELFKDVAHFVVGHGPRAEIDLGEPAEDKMQQFRFAQAAYLLGEPETVQNLAGEPRKGLEIAADGKSYIPP